MRRFLPPALVASILCLSGAFAAEAVLLSACATTPPSASTCTQWTAALAAAQAGLPPLEAAVAQALTPQQKADAQAALDAARALVTADQVYVAGRCVGVAG